VKKPGRVHTSSPTLIALPPQPGRSTRSPDCTDMGTILPSLSVAPGPTAMTVASGSGVFVLDVGRNRPDVVFCVRGRRNAQKQARRQWRVSKCIHDTQACTHAFSLEALDEDAVEQRDEGLDGLERGGLVRRVAQPREPNDSQKNVPLLEEECGRGEERGGRAGNASGGRQARTARPAPNFGQRVGDVTLSTCW
jgi:hypothetical protein